MYQPQNYRDFGDNALLGYELVDDSNFLFNTVDVALKVGDRSSRDLHHHVHIIDHIVTLALAAGFFTQRSDGHPTLGPIFHMFDTQFINMVGP